MSDHYDVVVAGAGPAGAQCARDVAKRGHDVCVLETEAEDEFPRQSNKSTAGTFPSMDGCVLETEAEDEFPRQSNKSTAGTFPSMMAAFNVPDDVVMNHTDTVVLESPNEHYVQDRTGAVLEFAEFKRWLVAEGRDHGAEYRFDARVSNPITEGGEAVGVEYNGDEEVYADVVVDATGPAAPLAQALGVVDLERENQAIGIEYEFEGVDVDHPDYADLTDAMMLRLDHDLAPGGYSWIFHTGEDTAKVGLCYIQNETHEEYARDGMAIDDYLEYWLDRDPRFDDATRLAGKMHRGSAHIQPPENLSTDGFMAIGDTVPTIDPLWGEGIHKCMESGRAAAITADSCLTPDDLDTSAEAMAAYDRLWHDQVAPKMRTRLLMTDLLYHAPNERYDKLMRDLQQADRDTLRKANEGDPMAMRELFHLSDVPMLARYARQRLGV